MSAAGRFLFWAARGRPRPITTLGIAGTWTNTAGFTFSNTAGDVITNG